MSSNKSEGYQGKHWPDESTLRDRNGRRWIPLQTGAQHYIREGQRGEPALAFKALADQFGPMTRISNE